MFSSFTMASSSFITLLFIVFLSNQLRMSSALKEKTEEVINLGGMQNEELSSLIAKNTHQDETISELKGQLKNHEDRIHYLERKMIDGSQKSDQMSNAINNQPKSNDDIVFSSNKMRMKRPYRLLPAASPAGRQSNKRKDGEDDPTKRMPSSCADLNSIGHTLNAFYVVKEKMANSTKLQTIYCDFQKSSPSDNIMEKRLGFIDIKSSLSGIYFYVQGDGINAVSKSKASGIAGIVRYNVQKLNLGNAMNRSSGVFTVPKSGVYHLELVALHNLIVEDPLVIHLRVNGAIVASSPTGFLLPRIPVIVIPATLKLRNGDRVDVFLEKGNLAGCTNKCIHFTGWLLEED